MCLRLLRAYGTAIATLSIHPLPRHICHSERP